MKLVETLENAIKAVAALPDRSLSHFDAVLLRDGERIRLAKLVDAALPKLRT
jgi:hypothetical protein